MPNSINLLVYWKCATTLWLGQKQMWCMPKYKIEDLCTSFAFAEVIAKTALPKKVRWGKNLNFRVGLSVGNYNFQSITIR